MIRWQEKKTHLLHTRNSTTETKKRKDISCYMLEIVKLTPIFKNKQLLRTGNSRTDTRVVFIVYFAPLTLGLDNSSRESDEYTDFDVFRTPPNNARGTMHCTSCWASIYRLRSLRNAKKKSGAPCLPYFGTVNSLS